ncbi:outer membrane beta-barrel protein [Lacihabitans sp. CS3-21]|uniref:outer membrane beta-barrel protein n=1 Tax=Lacihabitans sp. CS3-21 TaxID=2487332 RepID=UPI0020CEDB0D|nr:outer membrane beta-barrel protein [Lacihabitans sp. CS3-21]MCP9746781.1 hypothetical protein [Lacihabitans sp. CS3-21]
MLRFVLLFSFVFFTTISVFSQKIQGKVVDKNQNPMEMASVMLLDAKDSSLVSFVSTTSNGVFEIKEVTKGNLLVQITYLGYENFWNKLTFEGNTIELGTIVLKENTKELQSLVVSDYGSPMEFGKDTVTYNAAAFKIKAGDVVEDLLKKLPGVEVERDGSVKAFGENVQNVLVDGKEFFGKDTKIATKNLDADAIEKVQVFDKKSDMAEFTGIEDGQDERTINLKLKPGKKAGYFGTAELAGGTSERFKGRASINRFSPKSRISFIGLANNINEQNFSMEDYISFMGGIGSMMSGGGMNINLGENGGLPMGLINNQGVQKSFAGGLNYAKDFNKKTSLVGSIFINDFFNDLNKNVSRENFLKDASYWSQILGSQNSNNLSTSFNLKLTSKISAFQNVIFRLDGGLGSNRLNSVSSDISLRTDNSKINENDAIYNISGNNYRLNPDLTYQQKFSKLGRSMVLKAKTKVNHTDNNADLDAKYAFYSDQITTRKILQNQQSANEGVSYELNAAYIEPFGKKRYLEFSAGMDDQNNKLNTDFFDVINEALIYNLNLSTWYNRDYINRKTGLKYSSTQTKYNWAAGFRYENSFLKGRINNENTNITNTFNAILPELYYNYEFGNGHNFNLDYNTDMVEPSLIQLQPIVNNADPLNIYKGNPSLSNEYKHNLSMRYLKYNAFEFRMFYASFRAGFTQNKINNSINIDEFFVRTVSPVNSKNEQSGSGRIEYSTPIKPLKLKTKITLRSNVSNGFSLINDVWNQTTIFGKGLNFSIENRKKDKVDVLAGIRYYRSDSRYSENTNLGQFYTETTLFVEGSLNIGENVILKTNFDNVSYQQSFSKDHVNVPLWKTSITAFVDKSKKLRLTAEVFDILNQNKGISRNSNLSYNEISRTNVLGRYFLFGLSYNIKGFKKMNGIEIKMGDRD